MAIGLSYPKARDLQTKIVSILRADDGTLKCVLPKDAVIVDLTIVQTTDAVTDTGSFILGWSGDTNAIVEAFTMATTKVGMVKPGVSSGVAVLSKLTADRAVISTYTVGSSSAGGEGYVVINYFMPGPGEAVDG